MVILGNFPKYTTMVIQLFKLKNLNVLFVYQGEGLIC